MLTRSAVQAVQAIYVKLHIRVDSAASLESIYHQMIPISRHMGIRVAAYNGKRLTLSAPLAANINHQQSAFGGSLFSVAALAGWGLLQLKLTELRLDCDTVIAGGDVSYRRPVLDDFECNCELPDTFEDFAVTLRDTGKAAIQLAPYIESAGRRAMTLHGKYVVIERQPATP